MKAIFTYIPVNGIIGVSDYYYSADSNFPILCTLEMYELIGKELTNELGYYKALPVFLTYDKMSIIKYDNLSLNYSDYKNIMRSDFGELPVKILGEPKIKNAKFLYNGLEVEIGNPTSVNENNFNHIYWEVKCITCGNFH